MDATLSPICDQIMPPRRTELPEAVSLASGGSGVGAENDWNRNERDFVKISMNL